VRHPEMPSETDGTFLVRCAAKKFFVTLEDLAQQRFDPLAKVRDFRLADLLAGVVDVDQS
jgi:hypothetical protein